MRDCNGTLISAGTESGHAGTSEEAECKGIQAALGRAIQLQLKDVILETDCKGAADYLLNQPANLSWTSSSILDQAKYLSRSFISVHFAFCNRLCNEAAHTLASRADTSSTIASYRLKIFYHQGGQEHLEDHQGLDEGLVRWKSKLVIGEPLEAAYAALMEQEQLATKIGRGRRRRKGRGMSSQQQPENLQNGSGSQASASVSGSNVNPNQRSSQALGKRIFYKQLYLHNADPQL
ncbi:hypothetical protein FRX31_014947 [Thalictrum thalictroides]|uniref:RNase H type-1 domain-containing protein n=1 Tax=Thalictrum thalictroides TaxID=46969 RepID=A0A7J6WHB8_THATH|nr:hypothetical protein FRX31_014947 [Thalictrum thalictroides]